MASQTIDILLNPTIDVAKFNGIINTIKAAFTNFSPIDGAKLASSLNSIKPSIVGIASGADSIATGLNESAAAGDKLARAGINASKAFNFNNMVNAVQNVSSAFNEVASVGIAFEDGLAAVSAITGFTGKNLDVLGESARNLAKEFGGSATSQLTSFQGILSKLGPEMAEDSEALATYAKNVNILSKASGDDAATSMQALTDSLLQMGLASGTPAQIANESTKAINILAASAQVGAAEIPQVAQALLASGVAAKGANMSLVDVNAAIQVLAVGGKTGAEAGTALRNVLGLMQKASGPAESAMAKLGTSSKELGRLLTTEGLDVALAKINEGMNKVGTDAEKNAILMEIFGTENAAAAGIMLQNTDKFAAFSKGIEEGMQGQGAAFEQAGIRMNTAGEMINRVQAYVSDAFIGITQSIGQGATALIGASAQFAPLITSFAGLGSLIPEGMFSNAISSMKSLGATIISSVVPGLVTQDIATKSIVFNTNALTVANIKNAIASKAKLALDYLQSTAIYQLVAGQISLNAAMAANPIGFAIAGAVALGGALYLLYDNVESVRNVFDMAWGVIVDGAKIAWDVIKAFGSVLYDVGGLVFDVFTAPFQIAWGIISGVGSAIGSLISSLFGVAEGGQVISSVFLVLNQAGASLINLFDTVKATISGITAVVSSVVGSVTETISQVFSLDFSGAWDSLTGAGDKAAQAFNESYNAKMRTAKFDEAANAVVKGMEKANDLEIKIKAKSDFSDTLKAYQETQNKINDLSNKPKASLTKAQTDELDRLKIKAAEYSNEIQKVAPAAVNSMSAIVGANGQITNSYDINIAKATEFSKANDLTSVMETQKNAVSNSINTMAANYSRQVFAAEKLKKELEKPVTNQAEYDKLTQSFNEANKKAEEMKTKLVDNFLKAGQAGLLTQNAVDGVAKGLGVTNEAAKNMLISKELEKSADAGVLTEKQISKLTTKYGVSKEQVQKIYENQKKITDETKATQQAAEGWSGALDRVKKEQEKARETAYTAQLQYKKGLITKEELDEQTKLAESTIKSKNEEVLVLRDVNNAIKANKNLRTIGLEDEKKSTSETTKAKKTQYEIDKDSFELLKKNQKLAEEKFIREQATFRLQTGFIATEKSALTDKIEANKRTLADYEAQSKALKTMLSDAEKLPAKDNKRADAIKDVTEKQKELNNELEKTNSEIQNSEVNISIDDAKQRAEFDKLKLDAKNLELESKVKLGFITESEKLSIEIENINIDKSKLQSEIDKIKNQIATSGTNQELENKIQSYENQILKLDTDIAAKQSEQIDKSARERINSIADSLERERQLRLYELQRTYDEEVKQAQGNTQKLLAINLAYNDARNKTEQDYLSKTSFSYNALTKLSTAFANIKVGSVDRNEIVNLNKTKSDLAKERQELENSYAIGKTDYESYQKSLSDIQNKESENRIAIEEAEADRKKAVWSGFTTAVTGYFTTMYDEYSKKASESVNAVTITHQLEYERKRDLAIAEKALKYATETDNYTLQFAMSVKRQELQNQEASSTKAATDATAEAYANLAVMSSAYLGQMLVEQKNTLKALAMASFSALKGMAAIYMADITAKALAQPDSVATFGSTGIGRAAIIGALLYGAIGAAESVVMGAFKDGVVNLQGKGTGTSDSNLALLSAGESVITARGTKHGINQKFFNFTNKTGGNLYDFIQADPTIQRDLAKQRIMQNYDTVMKQKLVFDAIVEDYRLNNKNLERSNRELQKNQIALLLKLDEINNTLQTTKIINSQHNYKVDVNNNVVGALQSTDIFRS